MKLCFPEKILHQHGVVLGKTGAGKSSKLRHIVEHLLEHNKRVCIVDPKGDWWGLKKSADGKSAGRALIAFGDFKEPKASDVPINAQSGKHIAELITSGNRPCILGFRGWMPGALIKFWLDFAPALFNAQSGELYLVIDEVHNFAPKGKILDPEAGRCIHWTNRLMSEGRGLGLICFIASQRPQKVHNDTLTCCETLIAARVIHKADRDAVKDWIDGCGDSEKGDEVLNGLAQLARPEAWVWSPEAGFGPEIISFPMFETFDSFAPPQLQKAVTATNWSTVNLDDVREKLASVIEEQKANDPALLKAEGKRLKAELAKLQKQITAPAAVRSPQTTVKIQEVPVFSKLDLGTIEDATAAYDAVKKALGEFNSKAQHLVDPLNRLRELSERKFQALPSRASASEPRLPASRRTMPPVSFQAQTPAGDKPLPKAEAAILRVLANYPDGKSKREVGVIAGYKHSGGGFNNAIGSLRSLGYVLPGEPLRITEEGMAAHGPVQPLPTGDELFDYWMNHPDLGKAEREILRVLVQEAGGGEWSKEEIAPLTVSDRGTPYEANGGGFNNAIGRLRTYELITGKGRLRAVKEFFEP